MAKVMGKLFVPIGLLVLQGASLAAVEKPTTIPAHPELTVDGQLLVSTSGMTLYNDPGEAAVAGKVNWRCTRAINTIIDDQQSGLGKRPAIGSALFKSCLDRFRPYVAPPEAEVVGEYSVVTRPEGTRQWAFRDTPLYFSAADHKPGDRNSPAGFSFEGRRGMGFADLPVPLPAGFALTRQAKGLVLVDAKTRQAFYTPAGGRRPKTAMGDPRAEFQPVPAPAIATLTGDWSVIDRGDGEAQYAYQGQPLHVPPPGLNKIDLEKVRQWKPVVVVPAPPVPAAITEQLSLTGKVFATHRGMTLYAYRCNSGGFDAGSTCDTAGDPAAYMVSICGDGAECARRWQPYRAAPGDKPLGEFSISEITYPMFTDMKGGLYPPDAPRVKVWTYRGRPLFTYYEDRKPGDIWGDGIGGLWGSGFSAMQVPGKSAVDFEP